MKMASSQDAQRTEEVGPLSQDSHDIQSNHQHSPVTKTSGHNLGSASIAVGEKQKVSRADIELVQNLIERCLQLYMNKADVVRTLSNRARIEPDFTALVWQKLEEENSEFFRSYYIRLKLKKQIILFNQLLEHQYHMMKYPLHSKVSLAPVQNGIPPVHVEKKIEPTTLLEFCKQFHESAVNNLPMGYPVLQPQIPSTVQLHVDPTGRGFSSCHVVNGVPAPGSFDPIPMNSGISGTLEGTLAAPQCMSEMAVTSSSVASSNHFPFSPSEIPTGVDASTLDTNFTSDVLSNGGLQLGAEGVTPSRDSIGSLGQLWSLSDLTTDFAHLRDLSTLEDYTGSPFLPSDSEILLDSPEHDDIVEEFFADPMTIPCSQSDEDK